MSKQETIGPKSRKQEMFINSTADVTIFGGAAGAGKTFLGIMDFLKHIRYSKFRGLITRRTTPQLKGPGGVLDNCLGLFKLFDKNVKWKDKDGKFVFTSGAEIFLKHFEMEKDQDNFQGAEVNLFLVDEGQQFTETQVRYLMSRMRNPKCEEVPPHMKITCNPLADSFLRAWVDWYLIKDGPEAGRPDVSKDGVIRYFRSVDGKVVFGGSVDELIKLHGPLNPDEELLTYTFISANVYDNPVVMQKNPKYVSWLQGLKHVEKERLLYGNWDAREDAAGYFKREWCDIVPLPPLAAVSRVRAWDIAGTMPSEAYPNPDYTAGVKISKTKEGRYTVEDVLHFRDRAHGVLERILKTAKEDGRETMILIPADPGAAGKAYAAQIIKELAEHGFYARIKTTHTSKVTRFAPFAAIAEAKLVDIVKGQWNDLYFNELERFDGSRNVKDD
jgi:predicted phage terminase large subunit-like protein